MNTKIRNILIGLVVFLFAVYFFYEASNLLYGFSAKIFYPKDGEVFFKSHIEVSGQVNNASFITLNGRKIFTDEKGFFTESLILAPGINIIELSAEDRLHRTTKDKRTVVVNFY